MSKFFGSKKEDDGVASSDTTEAKEVLADVSDVESSEEKVVPNKKVVQTLDGSAVVKSVFDDEVLGKYYEPPDTWENKHRFDPQARWSHEEEKKVVRKCDLLVMTWTCIMFVALQLDRGNISNAVSDDMLPELGLTTNDFNTGQTIFYTIFLFAELPSQLISKAIGVDRWVPIQIVAWSAIAMSQAALKNKAGFYITRALLGLLEGGFIPDMVLYLSYFYKQKELDLRLTYFWVGLYLEAILGNMIAAAILLLRNDHWSGWRYLFVIEGAFTCFIGIISAFWLPPSPTQTKGLLRGKKGWFTEREEIIIVNRVLRDDPSKSDMHNRQAVSFRNLIDSFLDYDLWPMYWVGLTFQLATSTVGAYFTLTLRRLKFTTFQTNMLVVPSNVLQSINTFILYGISKYFNERSLVTSIHGLYVIICFIAIVSIPDNTATWARYALLVVTVSSPYPHPIFVSWTSANSNSVRTRSVAQSLYNMHCQASSIVSSNIYRADDAPYYHRGNRVLLGLAVLSFASHFMVKAYYVLRNRYKARKWNALTQDEKEEYVRNPPQKGNKRWDFQFYH